MQSKREVLEAKAKQARQDGTMRQFADELKRELIATEFDYVADVQGFIGGLRRTSEIEDKVERERELEAMIALFMQLSEMEYRRCILANLTLLGAKEEILPAIRR